MQSNLDYIICLLILTINITIQCCQRLGTPGRELILTRSVLVEQLHHLLLFLLGLGLVGFRGCLVVLLLVLYGAAVVHHTGGIALYNTAGSGFSG